MNSQKANSSVIATLFILLIIGGFIYLFWESTLEIESTESTTEEFIEETLLPINDNTEEIIETVNFEGFSFSLLPGWDLVEMRADNIALINVLHDTYETYLTVTLDQQDELYEPFGDPLINTDVGSIYNEGCGGPMACYGIFLENDAHLIVFDSESNEPVPEDLDGIWSPSINVTQEDILEFLKTLH